MEEPELPPERRLTASKGLIGFLVAVAATFFAAAIIGIVYAAAGADLDDRSFIFVGTIIQDAALIGAAFFVTADLGRPTWATFGLRPFQSVRLQVAGARVPRVLRDGDPLLA